jgi:hypothetical protein
LRDINHFLYIKNNPKWTEREGEGGRYPINERRDFFVVRTIAIESDRDGRHKWLAPIQNLVAQGYHHISIYSTQKIYEAEMGRGYQQKMYQ